MLNLIRLAPMLAAVILPLVGGGVLAGLQELRYRWLVIPHELALQRAALIAEYERKVAEAIAAEQLRQFKIIERLMAEAEAMRQAELDDYQAKIDLLEGEIEDYENAEGDSACRLDQGDLDFLLGAPAGSLQHPQPASTGRR